MPTLTPHTNALFDDFAKKDGVTPEMARNLRSAVYSSPLLIEELNRSVATGNIRNLAPVAGGAHAGAQYHAYDGSVRISLQMLSNRNDGSYQTAETVFVLAHEIQHSFNNNARAQAQIDFERMARSEAKKNSPTHDYTALIRDLIASNRKDEATAEIAGWNAVVSSLRTEARGVDLGRIFESTAYRMQDFVEKTSNSNGTRSYSLKSNLSLNDDFTIEPTP